MESLFAQFIGSGARFVSQVSMLVDAMDWAQLAMQKKKSSDLLQLATANRLLSQIAEEYPYLSKRGKFSREKMRSLIESFESLNLE